MIRPALLVGNQLPELHAINSRTLSDEGLAHHSTLADPAGDLDALPADAAVFQPGMIMNAGAFEAGCIIGPAKILAAHVLLLVAGQPAKHGPLTSILQPKVELAPK